MDPSGKEHWLLVVYDCTDPAWNNFWKEKSDLKNVMMAFIKDLKATEGIYIRYVNCGIAG